MNSNEVADILEVLTGLWPRPEMTKTEIKAYISYLSENEYLLCKDVVLQMASNPPQYRPNLAEFIHRLKTIKSNKQLRENTEDAIKNGLPAPEDAPTETALSIIRKAKECLVKNQKDT